MKKISLGIEGEEVFYTKLGNGLDVYLYHRDDCNNNYVTFTTKFGSIYHEFVPNSLKKMIKVPYGVAHFLEHKVFVQENDPQPEEFFAKRGAISNAYTTFKNTTYLFSGTDYLKENICFLLDYVQSPYFTEENVESEKGIITQEIHMCQDNLSEVMYEYIRKNVFHHNPYRDSIIGEVADINKITKDILYTCYQTFYHPSNMFLVVTGNFDLDEIMEAIVDNQAKKEFEKMKEIKVKPYKEEDSVVRERQVIYMKTPIPKVSYNLKISLPKDKDMVRKYNLYLFILFCSLFDDTSIFDEELKQEGIITNSVSVNFLNCDSHLLISLMNETKKYEELIRKIDKKLHQIEISKEDFERKKKVLISNELFSFENIEVINETIIDNIIFNDKLQGNMMEVLNSLTIEEMKEIIDKLDLTNKSIIVIRDKK